ncbi:MAG: sporulation protein [Acidimicrobiia bacterium]|nr:sporulation protein [Acidimicrobiia bacterium]
MDEATNDESLEQVFASVSEARDAASVRRVYGEPYELDGVTLIPVARIASAGGGGGGNDPAEGDGGYGSGYALAATPVGVYEVRDGEVSWRPTVDTASLARRGQVLAGVIAVCVTAVLVARRR